MRQKYVRHSTEGFIVWHKRPGDSGIWHKEMTRMFPTTGEILSAGFVTFDENHLPVCRGYSESLDLGSRPEDTNALREQWGLPPSED